MVGRAAATAPSEHRNRIAADASGTYNIEQIERLAPLEWLLFHVLRCSIEEQVERRDDSVVSGAEEQPRGARYSPCQRPLV